MCCSDPPPPPDLGPMSQASVEVANINAQTAAEQLSWAKEQDTRNQELLQQVLDIQLPAMREQFEQASSDRERYNTLFKPMEDAFVQEAKEYDTPQRRAEAQARAISDVSTQFDAQRQNALQRLERYGVDPSQTRNAALDVGVRTAQAAASAGAAGGARQQVEQQGRALRGQAINLGRGVLTGAGQFYGQSGGAGAQALQGGLATTGSGIAGRTSGQGFSNLALQGYGQGANILTQGYGNEMDFYQAGVDQTTGMLSGAGSVVGAAMAINDGGVIEGEYEVIDPEGDVTGPSDGSGVDDQIPAYLSDGEYVIPADVVQAKGEEFFDKLLEKFHMPANQQRAIG